MPSPFSWMTYFPTWNRVDGASAGKGLEVLPASIRRNLTVDIRAKFDRNNGWWEARGDSSCSFEHHRHWLHFGAPGIRMHYLTDVLRDYFKLSGRLSRKGYWMYILELACFAFVLGFLEGLFRIPHLPSLPVGWLLGSFLLIMAIPNWTSTVRRLHDANWRGWWVLVCLVPYVGALAVAIVCMFPSSPSASRFGVANSADRHPAADKAATKYAVLRDGKLEEL